MNVKLFLEIQLLQNCRVASWVILLEIDEMSLTISDHTEEATARMVVLLVFLEVIGEFCDPLAQKSDLNLRRASILVMDSDILDNLGLLSCS